MMSPKIHMLSLIILLLAPSYGQAQTDVCTFTPDIVTPYTPMTLEATALVSSNAVSGSYPNYVLDDEEFDLVGMRVEKFNGSGPDIQITFQVENYDADSSPDKVNVNFIVTNLDSLLVDIDYAFMEVSLPTGLEALWENGIPNGALLIGRSGVEYNSSAITVNGTETIQFLVQPSGEGGVDMPEGQSELVATVYFSYGGTVYGTILPAVCVERVTTIIENAVYEHGFTALTFFVVFFAAIALTVLGVWLFLHIRQRRRDAAVSPTDERRVKDKGNIIVMDTKEAMKRGVNPIKDFSLIAWNDSLVYVLALKDKLQMQREVDNLDILATIYVDTEIEYEQNEATVQASRLLVQSLCNNGDMSKGSEEKANTVMQSKLRDLDRKLDTEYKKDLETKYTEIEAKNKEMLGDLHQQHKHHRHEVTRVIRDMPEMEQKKILELIDQEQDTNENELVYKLALEQNTEAEKLRKEYAIRKRIGIKEIQQNYIRDAIDAGKLSAQQAEWLMKTHKEQQEEIHRKYDDEISRQRMNLEEKLARRRALALASETQEDDSAEALNLMASLQLNLLLKMRKASMAAPQQLDEYTNEIQTDLHDVKDKMNKDKEIRQTELFKKLSQAKKKALEEKMKQQAAEVSKYMAESKSQQTDGAVDPVSYVDGLISLKSRHRKELSVLDNELDESHAQELEKLREGAVQSAAEELGILERSLIEKLKADGMSNTAIDKILSAHKKNMNDMSAKQDANRQNQKAKLKDELARRKREWEEQQVNERKEQQDLREHESEVVEKLLASQVAVSEEERDRIIREHEKQMVIFENSLTLNKLKQKQMLEEKIAQRRAKQNEELQQKQNAELMKQRKFAENNGEEDDEDTMKKEAALMKKHVEQRITSMHHVNVDLDAEMEEVRIEMTKERALVLKDQEEKLGALIASMQMGKAREVARIEEQQKAINSLKANLMDDLNARGILSTPECERVLNIHKEEQDRLVNKLDGQRSKQEQMLKNKLHERLAQRESLMQQEQENEMRTLLEKTGNRANANIRRMVLMHKQMVQMEKFRNKIEKEISQTLENTKREFEIQKQRIFQEQEMQFLAGLVKIGHLSRNELVDVLHMLFPNKTEESILEILGKIYQGDPVKQWADSKAQEEQGDWDRRQSSLADRIYISKYSNPTPLHRRGSVMTMSASKNSGEPPKKVSRKTSRLNSSSNLNFSMDNYTSGRPDNSSYLHATSGSASLGPLNTVPQYQTKPQAATGKMPPLRRQSKSSLPEKHVTAYSIAKEKSNYDHSDEDEVGYGRRHNDPRRRGRVNHNGSDEDDEEEDYRSQAREKQGRLSDNIRSRQQGKRINHNGDDDESEEEKDYGRDRSEDESENDYYNSRHQQQRRQGTTGRLPPLRNQGGGSKKKSKLLKKLANEY